MRIVMLAFGVTAERMLIQLSLRNVTPEALIVSRTSAPPGRPTRAAAEPRRLHVAPRRIIAAILRRALRLVEHEVSARHVPDPHGLWCGFVRHIEVVDSLHDDRTTSLLRRLAPDYVVLAGTGIVGENVLAVPTRGTINVHPGLLPWVRGLGTIERSIERGVAVGVSAHLVDLGIDTGPIIRRELVPVSDADTLRSLRRKAEARAAEVMAELMVDAVAGQHPVSTPQRERFPYCRRPTDEERARAEEAVAAGRALELYRQWLAAAGEPKLQDDDTRLPSVLIRPKARAYSKCS